MTMPQSLKAFDGGRIKGAVVIPTGVEVDIVWTITGNKVVKQVLHGIVAGGFTNSAAIAQAVYASIIGSAQWTAYKPFVNSSVSLSGVWIRDIRNPNLPWFKSTGAATPGTGVALALPATACAVVNLQTAFAGRSKRGRAYFSGFDSTALNTTTGNFSAAFQTALQNLMTAIETAMTASGITHAIANPARNAYLGRTGTSIAARAAAMVPVAAFSLERLTPNSQRRRAYVA